MTEKLVLHVLTTDMARGAQRYARTMRQLLDSDRTAHRTLTLHPSPERVLEPDYCLEAPKGRAARAGFDPTIALRLRRSLGRLRPNLVVAHGSTPLKYLAWARPSVPIVYYKIGVVHAKARRPLRRWLHRATLQQADRIAGVSQECVDEVRSLFGVRGPHVVIPNGRDPSVFRPAEDRRDEADSAVTLLFVGHLSRTKRPERFVEVVRRLEESGLPVRGWIVGDGPMRPGLERRARGVSVELLGRRDDVPALLRQADVFVFTSVPEGEGLPGVFIEAGLSGLPIVATDVPGTRTVVVPEETGFVVPPDDLDQLVDRVRSLVIDRRRRRAMGEAARRRCEAELSMERSITRWSELLSTYGL